VLQVKTDFSTIPLTLLNGIPVLFPLLIPPPNLPLQNLNRPDLRSHLQQLQPQTPGQQLIQQLVANRSAFFYLRHQSAREGELEKQLFLGLFGKVVWKGHGRVEQEFLVELVER
jgi:hypothetical protein